MSHNIVFIPGLILTKNLFLAQEEVLKSRPDITITHANTCGHASITAMAEEILASQKGSFIPVGLSMGGYVAAELAKCNIETTVMEGNLSCSGKTYQNVVDAIVKTFSNLDHIYEPGKTVVTDGGSYSNNSGSTGFIRLQSPYNPKTHILIGTCYGDPCLLNKVEKYKETIIPIDY